MIRVHMEPDSVTLSGHAGAAPYGQDIVCAAVSVLTINLYNSIIYDRANLAYRKTETLCAIIAQRKDYKKGTDIRLISCYTGSKEDGVAQYIANKLGVTVWAPDKLGIISKFTNRYRIYSGSEKGVEDGTFVPFTPNNRKEAVK